jgi:hypothetical protein
MDRDEDIDSWKDAEEKACVPNKGHVYGKDEDLHAQ